MQIATGEVRAVADAIRSAAEHRGPDDTNQTYYDRVAAAAIRAMDECRSVRTSAIRPGLDRALLRS